MLTKSFVGVAAAVAAVAHGSPIEPRSIVCNSMLTTINNANGLAAAQTYCRSFLAIVPVTTISTSTNTQTRTSTSQLSIATTSTITPATVWKTRTTTTTAKTTTTPDTVTTTVTQWHTAYIDNEGSTIEIDRRSEPSPVALERRAPPKPAFFAGLSAADLKSACQCLNLPTSTYTLTASTVAFSTKTITATHTSKTTTTLATPLGTTTGVQTNTLVFIAKAPVVTIITPSYYQDSTCPPDLPNENFQCPEGTGDDDQSDPDLLTCAVETEDNFNGDCIYWSSDGSPAGSTLVSDDGTESRDATYGDQDSDDCPAWSDYFCSASSSKRSILDNPLMVARRESHDDEALLERAFDPIHVPQKMPKGLHRGGQYRVPSSS